MCSYAVHERMYVCCNHAQVLSYDGRMTQLLHNKESQHRERGRWD